jgi:hypothetical protein
MDVCLRLHASIGTLVVPKSISSSQQVIAWAERGCQPQQGRRRHGIC